MPSRPRPGRSGALHTAPTSQELRLSWDFLGSASTKAAEHFAVHLRELLAKHALGYAPELEGHEGATSVHLRVPEADAEGLRTALRPRRVEAMPPPRET